MAFEETTRGRTTAARIQDMVMIAIGDPVYLKLYEKQQKETWNRAMKETLDSIKNESQSCEMDWQQPRGQSHAGE